MTITEIFNMTSKQTVSIYSLNGQGITVLDLGYVSTYEFCGEFSLVVTGQSTVLYIDSNNNSTIINKDSIVYVAAMNRFQQAKLLSQDVLGAI